MSVLKFIVTQSISVCTTMKSVLFEAMIPTVLPSHSVKLGIASVSTNEDLAGVFACAVMGSTAPSGRRVLG